MAEHNYTKTEATGRTSSYIIGFILSLVFTIIPYYLVTRGIFLGTTLLLIILGFAIIQMFIQVFFFLHLGRGPKPLYNVIFFCLTAGLITLVIGASLLIMNNLYRNMAPMEVTTKIAQEENIAQVGGKQTGACEGNKANHTITIKGNQVSPAHTTAERCDTLSFISGDGASYSFMFMNSSGTMVSYGGIDNVSIQADHGDVLTLNQTGDFSFMDHSKPSVMGDFSVKADTK